MSPKVEVKIELTEAAISVLAEEAKENNQTIPQVVTMILNEWIIRQNNASHLSQT